MVNYSRKLEYVSICIYTHTHMCICIYIYIHIHIYIIYNESITEKMFKN